MRQSSFVAIAILQIIAAGAVIWLLLKWPGGWDWQRCLGAALVLAGMFGITTARFQLGRSFSITAQAHQLVTRGIYAKIRNPIYVFGTVFVSGIVLLLHRPKLWLVVLFIVIMQTLRAHREAQVLEAAFGDAYRDYRRKTWF